MSSLILRHEPGAAGSEIYRVWSGDERVGTIRREDVHAATYWPWHITGLIETGERTIGPSGRASSREEAMEQFRSAFVRLLAVPHHRPGDYPYRKG
ncbi:hypothetical protein [Kaistia sp. MMO-174]|uniref:hypothetical protein n=1 Tax=Kaistia sp. MMO-174 TaxID=3081256 RepID=UPI00301A9995